MPGSRSVSDELVQKTYDELGYDPKTGTFTRSSHTRVSPSSSYPSPYFIPAIEKTRRQWTKDTGYQASAAWQTMSLLRDLLVLWSEDYLSAFTQYPLSSSHSSPVVSRNAPVISRRSQINIGTIRRLRTQVDDAGRSMVSTFEEGWTRPSTKEFLDFIGFSHASLIEIRGDIDRTHADGLLTSAREFPPSSHTTPVSSRTPSAASSAMASAGIPTPSRNFPYPPLISRRDPVLYGKVRERLWEYTGHDIDASGLTFELFIELINKCSYLLRRTVEGLWGKLSRDEQAKYPDLLDSIWSRR
ncbi:four helix bundle protein [Candidatus Gottesmanbacteria bacterium]|nr:four helix bundle protein [Candidatus Gottesmanbacteria bacterium]